jgi:hypothetical protein
MSTLNIENAKKFGDLTKITEAPGSALLLIHDGTGVKSIDVTHLLAGVQVDIATTATAGIVKPDGTTLLIGADGTLSMAETTAANAGAHNCIYRGKNLGTAVTAAQYAAIADGSFKDMFIGDYWVIGGVTYRIAAFDYYLRCGDTDLTTHHVTLVPDDSMYTHVMNDSNVTTGGYYGSKMYTTGLTQAKTTINTAFGAAHVLSHRQYLTNAVSSGRPSGGSWYDSTVELMNEHNVYGGTVFAPTADGSNVPANYTIDKSQFPLFSFRPDLISNRNTYWLRDVITAANFARVRNDGNADYNDASYALGVRPAFSIKS